MISTPDEYGKALDELRVLELRLQAALASFPLGTRGYTKASLRKMIARLHEELAEHEARAVRPVGS